MIIVADLVFVHQCLHPSFAIGAQIPNNQIGIGSEAKVPLVLMSNFPKCSTKRIVFCILYPTVLDKHAIVVHAIRALRPAIAV